VDKYFVQFIQPEEAFGYNQIFLAKIVETSEQKPNYSIIKICFVEKTFEQDLFLNEVSMTIEEALPVLLKMQDAKYFKTFEISTRTKYSIDHFIERCMELL